MSALQCFIDCIVNAGLALPVIILFSMAILLLTFFLYYHRYELILGAQSLLSIIIAVTLLSMNCYMHMWIWIYLGLVLIGSIIFVLFIYLIDSYFENKVIGPLSVLSDIEKEFKVKINIMDTPIIRAFVFMKRIYLSIGLLERLEKDEIRAVVAHEVYHLRYSPNKIFSFFLSLASLSFYRYSDEYSADRFAARVVGKEKLITALEKLDIKDSLKRIRSLSSF